MKATLTTTNLQTGERWQETLLDIGPVNRMKQVSIYANVRGQQLLPKLPAQYASAWPYVCFSCRL